MVELAVALLEVFNDAAGRSLGAWASGGRPSSSLKQVIGALLARPDTSRTLWEDGIRAIVANPPGWLDGHLQVGHVFGERAVEWTLSAASLSKDGTKDALQPPRWVAWVDENLPELEGYKRDLAISRAGMLGSSGWDVTPDVVHEYVLSRTRPDDEEAGESS